MKNLNVGTATRKREGGKMGFLTKRLLALGLIFTLMAGCSKGGASEKPMEKEKIIVEIPSNEEKWGDAPDFTLPRLGGGKFTLSSLKGKIIIVDFWATRCPPCREEIPDFISLYKEYKDKGLEIVGIALDRGGESVVGPFAEKMGINYILVFGGQEVTEKYGGIRGIPTTFIIDQNGNIAEKYIGFRPKNIFENEIKKLLSK